MILKPMNVGEILDYTLKLFKGQFKSYLGVVGLGLASMVGLVLIVVALHYSLGRKAAFNCSIVAFIQFIMVNVAMHAGLIKMASEQILDRKMSSMEAYRFGFSKAWRMLFSGILYFIIIMIGLILLIIPGVYFTNALLFFAYSIVIEDMGPWTALKRSKKLTKSCWWRCSSIVFLISLFQMIFSIVPRLATESLGNILLKLYHLDSIAPVVAGVFSISIVFLFTPLVIIPMTLLYYDLRIRKENLDLQVMVGNLSEKNNMHLSGE